MVVVKNKGKRPAGNGGEGSSMQAPRPPPPTLSWRRRRQEIAAVESANNTVPSALLSSIDGALVGIHSSHGAQLTLCGARDLDADTRATLFSLVESNTKDMYDRARGWGWNATEKSDELSDPSARFLLCHGLTTTDGTTAAVQGELLGFSHFRFLMDEDSAQPEPVLYIYEVQFALSARRRGLGTALMAVLEALASKRGMNKTILTVFKENEAAMAFYKQRMGYSIDPTSPCRHGQDEPYEILSKCVPPPAAGVETETTQRPNLRRRVTPISGGEGGQSTNQN